MTKVLVISTSRQTRGGITAVLKLYERSTMWQQYHCRWIGTHRDGNMMTKLWYLAKGFVQYLFLLPFYDIIHIHFSLNSSARRKYPFFKLAKALGKKTVIHLHCGSQIDEIWNHTYQTMFEQCDCGILLSNCLKQKIEQYIGKTNKLKVVYNPCPIINHTTNYKKRNHILYAGTLYEAKGYKDLIKTFAKIAIRYPDWKLVLAGNGETDQAQELAIKTGIEQQVKLLGWVNDEQKHKAFCEAKALCLPSYAEGFPMAVLDAWAYGLPVVTTDVGGIPDIADDGKNLLLFKPGDVDTLAEKLEAIISDEELCKRLSAESIKLATNKFSLNEITKHIGIIYEDLVRNS